jgi:hypothetical protein
LRTAYQPGITYNGKTETTPEEWYFWEKGSSLPLVAADLSNIEEFVANHQYPEPIDCPDITAAQITIATKNLKSGKPPSSDAVNDEVVKRTHHIINPPGALAFQLELATRISPYILHTIDHDTAKEARRRQNRHSGGHCTPQHPRKGLRINHGHPDQLPDGDRRHITTEPHRWKERSLLRSCLTHDLSHTQGLGGRECHITLTNLSHPRLIHNLKQRRFGGR